MSGMESAGTLAFLGVFPLSVGLMCVCERNPVMSRAGKWALIASGVMVAPVILRLFVGAIFG